jgi:hypothetical protein
MSGKTSIRLRATGGAFDPAEVRWSDDLHRGVWGGGSYDQMLCRDLQSPEVLLSSCLCVRLAEIYHRH